MNLKQAILVVLSMITLAAQASETGWGGRRGNGRGPGKMVERLKAQGLTDDQIQAKMQEMRTKFQAIKAQCDSEGLTREECHAKYAPPRPSDAPADASATTIQ